MTNQINNQRIIPSTDVIQLTLTLKMTTAQVVETSVTVNNNSPIQDYVHPDDQTQPTFEICFVLVLLSMVAVCLVSLVGVGRVADAVGMVLLVLMRADAVADFASCCC